MGFLSAPTADGTTYGAMEFATEQDAAADAGHYRDGAGLPTAEPRRIPGATSWGVWFRR